MFAAFLTTVLFSISAVAGNRTARLLGGTEAHFWRLLFATVLLAGFAHTYGGGMTGAAFPVFVVSGIIGFGIGDSALFQAYPRIGSRLSVMLVQCLASPVAALIEWCWLGTTLTAAEIICALAILAGMVTALAPREHLHRPRGELVAGVAFGVAAAICQAVGAVLSRKGFDAARLAGEDLDGITAAYQRILGGMIATAVVLLIVKRRTLARVWSDGSDDPPANLAARKVNWLRAWPLVLLNGLAGPALGVSCFLWALKTTPTGVVLPIVAITPLVIIPFARHFEGERPTARSLWGGLLAVLGAVALALVTQRHR